MYGYYEYLDSSGLTLILRMLAEVHSKLMVRPGCEELKEVMEMANELYQ